jgi:hypothetical protein
VVGRGLYNNQIKRQKGASQGIRGGGVSKYHLLDFFDPESLGDFFSGYSGDPHLEFRFKPMTQRGIAVFSWKLSDEVAGVKVLHSIAPLESSHFNAHSISVQPKHRNDQLLNNGLTAINQKQLFLLKLPLK